MSGSHDTVFKYPFVKEIQYIISAFIPVGTDHLIHFLIFPESFYAGGQDDQFALIPKEQDYLFAICKAVAQAHPDYKIKQKPMDEDGEENGEEESSDGEEDRYVLCTMPEVNDDRHDAGMDYVKTIYEEMTAKIDAVNAAYGAKIAKQLAGAKPEEMDEAKEELQRVYDQIKDICKSYREEKEKQIEEAYQDYLKKKAEAEQAESERQAARGEDKGMKLDLSQFTGKE